MLIGKFILMTGFLWLLHSSSCAQSNYLGFKILNHSLQIDINKKIKNNYIINLGIGESFDAKELKQTKMDASLRELNVKIKGYKFSKINNLYYINLNIGKNYTLWNSYNKAGLKIFGQIAAGPQLHILKPYRLKVYDSVRVLDIQYKDDSLAFANNHAIISRGKYWSGWQELQWKASIKAYFSIGMHYKIGKIYNELAVGLQAAYFRDDTYILYTQPVKSLVFETFLSLHIAYEKK